MILHILEEKQDDVKGTIAIPNVGQYNLTDEGRAKLRDFLTSSMRRKTTPMHLQHPPTFFETYRDEIGEIIKRVPDMLTYWQREGSTLKRRLAFTLCGLIALIIAIIGWLTNQRLISGEAMTFLAGTIIGYIFAFLQKYLV